MIWEKMPEAESVEAGAEEEGAADAELGEGDVLNAVSDAWQGDFVPTCEAPTGGDHAGCTAPDQDQCLATESDGEACVWRLQRARSFGDSVVHNGVTYLWQDKQARAQERTEAAQEDAKRALRDANREKSRDLKFASDRMRDRGKKVESG